MKIAHTIEIDPKNHRVLIEGVEFDFYIEKTPEVEVVFDGAVAVVRLSVYADNVIFGDSHAFSTTDQSARARAAIESKWVKREARRIVHEGMADTLKWLSDAAAASMAGYPTRFMAGLPDGSQPTTINRTN